MILIVDDNPENRESLKRQLTRVGYRAESVASHDALDYLRAVSPRLVILDITDPPGAGLDLLREIRRDVFTTDLPVVVRTTAESSAAQQEADRLGIHGHLPEENRDFIRLLSHVAQVVEPAV